MFSRPRLPELTKLLRTVADGEKIDVPDAALALVARSARGSFRDAVSTLDQLAAATDGQITVQAVLQLLGAVEEEALFRICDLIVDRDTGGLLTFVEELADQGQDLARLVTDLLEHLRHLLLVQHMGEVPESIPVTDETRERLRSQANQLGEPDVVRLVDLLALAVDDARQGGDPRLPLELALVKVTRPGADLSRESLSYRLEQLESRTREPHHTPAAAQAPATPSGEAESPAAQPEAAPAPEEPGERPPLELEQLQQLWQQAILPAVAERSIPAGSVLNEARPVELADERLVVEFPPAASFHRNLAEEPKNATLLVDAIREVTGRRLELAFVVGEGGGEEEGGEQEHEPETEEEFIALFKDRFDAREVD
jgi:DNA polymerase-3 subunit gamma/tau